MGFFDFLSSPTQDVESLQREQSELRKRKPQEPTPFKAPPQAGVQAAPPPQGEGAQLEAYKSKESELVKREGSLLKAVREELGKVIGSYDTERVKDALEKGRITPGQLAQDLDVIIKARENEGSPMDLRKLAVLRNGLSVAAQDRDSLSSMPFPSNSQKQIDPQSMMSEAQEAMRRSDQLRAEAAKLGVLSQDKKIQEADTLRAQAAAIQAEANRLSEAGRPRQMEGPQPPPPTSKESIPLQGNIDRNLAGSGKTPESFTLAIAAAWKAAEQKGGMEINGLEDQVPFSVALKTLLPILDPTQKVTMDLLDLANKQKATGVGGEIGGPRQGAPQDGGQSMAQGEILTELRAKQQQRRDLLLSLGTNPSSQNWLSAIVTILLSAVIGSERALSVMGYASRHNLLKYQLDLLHQEIKEDMEVLREQGRTDREVKMEAARRMTRKDDQLEQRMWDLKMEAARRMTRRGDVLEQRMWDLKKMDMQNRYIVGRSKPPDSKTENVIKKLEKEFDEVMSLSAKFSAGAKEPLNPKMKEDRAKFESYIQKAEELQRTLQVLRGTKEKPEEVPVGVEDDE